MVFVLGEDRRGAFEQKDTFKTSVLIKRNLRRRKEMPIAMTCTIFVYRAVRDLSDRWKGGLKDLSNV